MHVLHKFITSSLAHVEKAKASASCGDESVLSGDEFVLPPSSDRLLLHTVKPPHPSACAQAPASAPALADPPLVSAGQQPVLAGHGPGGVCHGHRAEVAGVPAACLRVVAGGARLVVLPLAASGPAAAAGLA